MAKKERNSGVVSKRKVQSAPTTSAKATTKETSVQTPPFPPINQKKTLSCETLEDDQIILIHVCHDSLQRP